MGMKFLNSLSTRVSSLKEVKTMKYLDKISKMENVISLGIGDPDFDTHQNIKGAAKRAIDKGRTHYTPSAGILELREAIAEYYKKFYNVEILPNNVIVTAGAHEATYLAFQTLFNRDDNVIVPDPGFLSYWEYPKLVDAKAISLPLRMKKGFQPDPGELLELITKRTKMIVVNYPNNPTGAILDEDIAKAIADIATGL